MSGFVLHPWTITLHHDVAVPIDVPTALLYLVTAAIVCALTVRRPAYGVAALIVLAPIGPTRYIGPTTMTLLKAGLLGLLLTMAVRRPDFSALDTGVVRAVVASLIGIEAATALSAMHADFYGPVIREAAKTLEYAALFLGAVIAYASDPDDRPFWIALQIVTVVVCVDALAQYVVGANSGIFIGGHPVPRIAGVLEGPNQLAGWLEVVIPVLLARNLLHRDGALVAVVALAALTELLTFSRAGIIATVFASAVVLIVMRAPRKFGIRFAVATITATVILAVVALKAGLPPGYFSLDQVPQQADHLGNRQMLWQAAIDLWHTSPIFGVGAGNYELDLPRVGLVDVRTHANSIYLQSLAEGGIVMFGATLCMFVTIIVALARSAVRRPIVVGMLAATAALAAHQIFDYLFFFPKVGSMFWLTLGVAVAEISAQTLFARRRSRVLIPSVPL
ncbi:MAG: O-antigen ligase family protein [Candidatus Velthaea sp.]